MIESLEELERQAQERNADTLSVYAADLLELVQLARGNAELARTVDLVHVQRDQARERGSLVPMLANLRAMLDDIGERVAVQERREARADWPTRWTDLAGKDTEPKTYEQQNEELRATLERQRRSFESMERDLYMQINGLEVKNADLCGTVEELEIQVRAQGRLETENADLRAERQELETQLETQLESPPCPTCGANGGL